MRPTHTRDGAFEILELSHAIAEGMQTYPGLPEPRLEALLDFEASRAHYGDQAEFYIASYHLCGNTGTYIDAPLHRHRAGADLSMLPLDRLVHVPIALIEASNTEQRAIGPASFDGHALEGKAVIVRTGFSRHFATPRYAQNHPYLTRAACELLVRAAPAVVCIDSLNIDDTADLARPAHTLLLAAGIPIVEHLTALDQLRGSNEFFHGAPVAWRGGASFPLRAYALRARGRH